MALPHVGLAALMPWCSVPCRALVLEPYFLALYLKMPKNKLRANVVELILMALLKLGNAKVETNYRHVINRLKTQQMEGK